MKRVLLTEDRSKFVAGLFPRTQSTTKLPSIAFVMFVSEAETGPSFQTSAHELSPHAQLRSCLAECECLLEACSDRPCHISNVFGVLAFQPG